MVMVSLLNIYDVPNTLSVLTHLIFPMLLQSGYHYDSHFRDEEMRMREAEYLLGPTAPKGSIQWPQSHPMIKRKETSLLENEDWVSLPVVSKSGWLWTSSNNNKDSHFPPLEILLQQIWLGPRYVFSQRSVGGSDDHSGWRSTNLVCALLPIAPDLNHTRRQTGNLWGTLTEYPWMGNHWLACQPPSPAPSHRKMYWV